MKYVAPQAIDLTKLEAELYARVPQAPTYDDWEVAADAMQALVTSLLEREAVPEVRLRLFADAAYAETGGRSPRDFFETNGTTDEELFRHPHFIPYLRHFIEGPRLPQVVVAGLCRILNEDVGTSGMVMKQYRKYAREAVREYGLSRSDAATEFFRLGAEIGMTLGAARTLRDAAKSA